jgi:predicted RNA-binding Zn ribbon-like protein
MPPLWIEFVNSDARDHRGHGQDEDRLDDPAWVRAWRDRWELGRVDLQRAEHRSALKELRALLRGMVQAIVDGAPLADADVDTLNRHLDARPVHSRLERVDDDYRVKLVPTTRGIGAVLFAIAVSFAEFLVEGDRRRLKTCENPDCGWVFYDETRSRTRRWCAPVCGNLIKVRRFRERQREEA